jgi:hypothetical protein
MSDASRPKIVITKDELRDARIDEALEHQRSYVPTPMEAPEPKFRLIYSAWFYLLLSGALGAFLAWALIEPHFHDTITFTGKIEALKPDELPPNFRGTIYEIRGHLTVAGADVWVLPERTAIRAAGTSSRLSLRELAPGEVVTVYGAPGPVPDVLLAAAVRLEDPRTPAATVVNVPEMAFQQKLFGFLLLPVVAGLVGFMIGGIEGIVCRTYSRAAWCAAIGLVVGLLGGTLSSFAANIVYGVLGKMASGTDPTASGPAFVFHMFQRGLAWTIAGMCMGLGQGFALKSSKLKFNGFIGGMVGGLLGGLFFDPINFLLLGPDGISGGPASRAVGLTIIGASVGLLIGLTDLLTRDAWLKVLTGPLQGKEFSFNRTPIRLGSSPKNEIYLFKDSKIDPVHAEIFKLRDAYEIVDNGSSTGTFLNGRRVTRERLQDGAVIKLGDSEFSYSSRENKAG